MPKQISPESPARKFSAELRLNYLKQLRLKIQTSILGKEKSLNGVPHFLLSTPMRSNHAHKQFCDLKDEIIKEFSPRRGAQTPRSPYQAYDTPSKKLREKVNQQRNTQNLSRSLTLESNRSSDSFVPPPRLVVSTPPASPSPVSTPIKQDEKKTRRKKKNKIKITSAPSSSSSLETPTHSQSNTSTLGSESNLTTISQPYFPDTPVSSQSDSVSPGTPYYDAESSFPETPFYTPGGDKYLLAGDFKDLEKAIYGDEKPSVSKLKTFLDEVEEDYFFDVDEAIAELTERENTFERETSTNKKAGAEARDEEQFLTDAHVDKVDKKKGSTSPTEKKTSEASGPLLCDDDEEEEDEESNDQQDGKANASPQLIPLSDTENKKEKEKEKEKTATTPISQTKSSNASPVSQAQAQSPNQKEMQKLRYLNTILTILQKLNQEEVVFEQNDNQTTEHDEDSLNELNQYDEDFRLDSRYYNASIAMVNLLLKKISDLNEDEIPNSQTMQAIESAIINQSDLLLTHYLAKKMFKDPNAYQTFSGFDPVDENPKENKNSQENKVEVTQKGIIEEIISFISPKQMKPGLVVPDTRAQARQPFFSLLDHLEDSRAFSEEQLNAYQSELAGVGTGDGLDHARQFNLESQCELVKQKIRSYDELFSDVAWYVQDDEIARGRFALLNPRRYFNKNVSNGTEYFETYLIEKLKNDLSKKLDASLKNINIYLLEKKQESKRKSVFSKIPILGRLLPVALDPNSAETKYGKIKIWKENLEALRQSIQTESKPIKKNKKNQQSKSNSVASSSSSENLGKNNQKSISDISSFLSEYDQLIENLQEEIRSSHRGSHYAGVVHAIHQSCQLSKRYSGFLQAQLQMQDLKKMETPLTTSIQTPPNSASTKKSEVTLAHRVFLHRRCRVNQAIEGFCYSVPLERDKRNLWGRFENWIQKRKGYDYSNKAAQINFMSQLRSNLNKCQNTNDYFQILKNIFIELTEFKEKIKKGQKLFFEKEYSSGLIRLFFELVQVVVVPYDGLTLPVNYGQMAWLKLHLDYLVGESDSVCEYHQAVLQQFNIQFDRMARFQGYATQMVLPELAKPAKAETSQAKPDNKNQREQNIRRFYRRFNGEMARHLTSLTPMGSGHFILSKSNLGVATILSALTLKQLGLPDPVTGAFSVIGDVADQNQQIQSAKLASDVLEEGNNLQEILNYMSLKVTEYVQIEASNMLEPEKLAETCYYRMKDALTKLITGSPAGQFSLEQLDVALLSLHTTSHFTYDANLEFCNYNQYQTLEDKKNKRCYADYFQSATIRVIEDTQAIALPDASVKALGATPDKSKTQPKPKSSKTDDLIEVEADDVAVEDHVQSAHVSQPYTLFKPFAHAVDLSEKENARKRGSTSAPDYPAFTLKRSQMSASFFQALKLTHTQHHNTNEKDSQQYVRYHVSDAEVLDVKAIVLGK